MSAYFNSHISESSDIGYEIAKKLYSDMDPSSMEALKRGGLTIDQLGAVQKSLEKVAEEAENSFGKTVDLSETKIQEFILKKMEGVISSVVETVKSQTPNLIAEAGVSEAVFSHEDDYRPILATESLATCIGVAGYDPQNKFGFVVHFAGKDEVNASGEMLLDRIRAYRTEDNNAPLLIHLRGGYKRISESTLLKIKEWIAGAKDLNSIIVSEDTLAISEEGRIPFPGSIKLDVRTGTCEPYDWTKNPYTIKKTKELDEIDVVELFVEVATKKPEIRIVYDPKK